MYELQMSDIESRGTTPSGGTSIANFPLGSLKNSRNQSNSEGNENEELYNNKNQNSHRYAVDQRIIKQDEDDFYDIQNINLREKTKDRLIFRKVPYHIWLVGALIFIVAVYLVYTLALGYFGTVNKGIKQRKVDKYPLSDIIDIKCYKRGHSGVNVYTIHYKVMIEFRSSAPIKLTETGVESKCIKQVCLIKNFLGMDCTEEEVELIDESTRL
eukprot:403335334